TSSTDATLALESQSPALTSQQYIMQVHHYLARSFLYPLYDTCSPIETYVSSATPAVLHAAILLNAFGECARF
ncbi:MAG: hypothetical protein Q8P59_06450, partial [Dehalococcoidia bacterium]|nr:hypothetical protein [Dehalococcoidia bacterium]